MLGPFSVSSLSRTPVSQWTINLCADIFNAGVQNGTLTFFLPDLPGLTFAALDLNERGLIQKRH
jgi:hypothetical protein